MMVLDSSAAFVHCLDNLPPPPPPSPPPPPPPVHLSHHQRKINHLYTRALGGWLVVRGGASGASDESVRQVY